MKYTAEQRVQRAHVWLMNNPAYCLYSGIFMLGTTQVVDDIPTAYTDGINKKYGRDFVDSLNDMELRGLVLHENLHVAFKHLTTWKVLYDKNKTLANMACDYVINLMIHDSDPHKQGVCLPEGGCLDERFRGMDAQQVFKLLQQQQEQQEQQNQSGGSGSGSCSGSPSQQPRCFDDHDWEAAQQTTPEQQQQQSRLVDQALRQGTLLAGKRGMSIPREVSAALTSSVNWREVLRDFINSVCADRDISTWRRPNRRWVDSGIYMPSVVGESIGRIVVGIDTSGSIGSDAIGVFLAELMSICNHLQPEAVYVLYWDASVAGHETYTQGNYESLLSSTRPKGGGGTDPRCVIKYLSDKHMKPECVVMLTDGYIRQWGEWDVPVFWAITSNRIAPCGVSVKVTS